MQKSVNCTEQQRASDAAKSKKLATKEVWYRARYTAVPINMIRLYLVLAICCWYCFSWKQVSRKDVPLVYYLQGMISVDEPRCFSFILSYVCALALETTAVPGIVHVLCALLV